MNKLLFRKIAISVFLVAFLTSSVFFTLRLVQQRIVLKQEAKTAPVGIEEIEGGGFFKPIDDKINNNDPLIFEASTPQTVFNSSGDDTADAPARWFVDKDGKVQMLAASFVGRRSIGDNLNDLTHLGDVIMNSDHDGNIRNYNDAEWLVAPYTLDGQTIYSLIHTEYHGWEHNNCPFPTPGVRAEDCWWNSLNLATSTNAGATYTHANPPNHNIANTSLEYSPAPNQSAVGYFNPSNIIKKGDYYYFLTGSHNPPTPGGTCIMRTNSLADPRSWKFWNGGGIDDFTLSGDRAICPQLTEGGGGNRMPNKYLGYNSYLQKYIAFECYEGIGGFCWYALSDDLINWGQQRRITELDGKVCMYGALVQPGDETRNFEVTDRSPWVYSTRSCGGRGNEGLGRVRLRISKQEDVGKYPVLDLKMSEKRGNKTLDSSFYGNDGTLSNASFGQDGDKNFVRFNGTNSFVTVKHDDSLNPTTRQISIKAKIKANKNNSGSFWEIVNKQDASGKRAYGLFVNSQGKLHFSLGENSNFYANSESTVAIDNGSWHEVVVIFDEETGIVSYYIDGQLNISLIQGGNFNSGVNTTNLIIGKNFSGDIDELTIYNYLLFSQNQIASPEKVFSCSSADLGTISATNYLNVAGSFPNLSVMASNRYGGTKATILLVDGREYSYSFLEPRYADGKYNWLKTLNEIPIGVRIRRVSFYVGARSSSEQGQLCGVWNAPMGAPTGTLTPTSTLTPTPIPIISGNKAIEFVSNSALSINTRSSRFLLTTDYSLEAWVNTRNGGDIFKNEVSASSFFRIYANCQSAGENCDLLFSTTYNKADLSALKSLPKGKWTHIAFTRVKNQINFFINGGLVASRSDFSPSRTYPILSSPAVVFLAKGSNETGTFGVVDDYRISNISRDIRANWTSGVYDLPLKADQNTVALWNFESSCNDESLNRNNCFVSGTSPYAPPVARYIARIYPPRPTATPVPISPTPIVISNKALEILKGTYISVNDSGKKLIISTSFSLEAWVNVSQSGTLIFRESASNPNNFAYFINIFCAVGKTGCDLAFGTNKDKVDLRTTAGDLPKNKWAHLAFVRLGNKISFYVNGDEVAYNSTFSSSQVFPLGVPGGEFVIGATKYSAWVSSNRYQGQIDDLRISNMARPINANWKFGFYDFPLEADKNTIALWDFDNNILDKSANKLHGNFINGAAPFFEGTKRFTTGNFAPKTCGYLREKVLGSYGRSCSDVPNYFNNRFDTNKDGKIDFTDYLLAVRNLYNSSWCLNVLSDNTNPCTKTIEKKK